MLRCHSTTKVAYLILLISTRIHSFDIILEMDFTINNRNLLLDPNWWFHRKFTNVQDHTFTGLGPTFKIILS